MIAQASNFVNTVDNAFIFILVISVFFLVLVTVLMITFVFKYNRKKNKKAINIHGNTALEITWTVIPVILVLFMFWYGWIGYKEMTNVPKNAMVVEVTAQMWKWTFKYDNGVQTESLYVPIEENVRLNLTSLDVNHSFYVPAFRLKKDVIPGRKNFMWFNADEVGDYNIECSNYCGLRHSYMLSKVVVMERNKFEDFMKRRLVEEKSKTPQDGDSLKTQNQTSGIADSSGKAGKTDTTGNSNKK